MTGVKNYMNYQSIVIFICILLTVYACGGQQDSTNSFNGNPAVVCVSATTDTSWYNTNKKAPLLLQKDLVSFPVSTTNEDCQKYINQGLALTFGFNHAEAARSFYYATKLDSTCAMAYWGFAYVLGPNYNAKMDYDNYPRAYEALQKAVELKEKCSSQEKALIEALEKRYVNKPLKDRTHLDVAYANAMKMLYEEYPFNTNIGTLYAEALLNLHPWDLWEKDGEPKAWTPEILSILKNVLELDSTHIGAHHFYIHAIEGSKTPEKGLSSATFFDKGGASKLGHLVHMPAHIYIRTGDYHKASLANAKAVKVDSVYTATCHAQGAYPLAYYPHNYHFLVATAILEGNSEWAIEAARRLSLHSDTVVMKEEGWETLQHFRAVKYWVYVKFGKWAEILAMPKEDLALKYPNAIRHFARGMAYVGHKDPANAKRALKALTTDSKDKSLENMSIWGINAITPILEIAQKVLEAHILASQGQYDDSIKLLKEAVEIEDELNYNEPPDWLLSVRHYLAAIQIESKEYIDAITTLGEDLARYPKNGWALHGIKYAAEQLNEYELVSLMEEELETAWKYADTPLTTSSVWFSK
ncbi:tetratricopeptide repeat protein [Sediminitomix flava]|uniref:Tetratricopeptide repeat protein n=1 Tax=Sediminitomix flava TaxID=379075 RepID=A0A315ZIF1_SEDFL|nr:tetratricopeptide repeat protein [Sediminitomix flava]PWJ45082.1 hypothetical protein BC781_1011486 [Sediminitomix flava]